MTVGVRLTVGGLGPAAFYTVALRPRGRCGAGPRAGARVRRKAGRLRSSAGGDVRVMEALIESKALGRRGTTTLQPALAAYSQTIPSPSRSCMKGYAGWPRRTGAMPWRRASLQVIRPLRLSSQRRRASREGERRTRGGGSDAAARLAKTIAVELRRAARVRFSAGSGRRSPCPRRAWSLRRGRSSPPASVRALR